MEKIKMTIMEGECIYCHQMRHIEVPEDTVPAEVDRIVTENCDCHTAKQRRELQDQQIKGKENVRDLLEDYDIVNIFEAAVDVITQGKAVSMVMDFGDGTKAQLKITTKGALIVKKVIVKQESKEA